MLGLCAGEGGGGCGVVIYSNYSYCMLQCREFHRGY